MRWLIKIQESHEILYEWCGIVHDQIKYTKINLIIQPGDLTNTPNPTFLNYIFFFHHNLFNLFFFHAIFAPCFFSHRCFFFNQTKFKPHFRGLKKTPFFFFFLSLPAWVCVRRLIILSAIFFLISCLSFSWFGFSHSFKDLILELGLWRICPSS